MQRYEMWGKENCYLGNIFCSKRDKFTRFAVGKPGFKSYRLQYNLHLELPILRPVYVFRSHQSFYKRKYCPKDGRMKRNGSICRNRFMCIGFSR